MRVKPLYRIDERPPTWWESLLYGWQHTLVDISPFVLPLAVAGALRMNASERAELINFSLVGMGLATLIQTTIGNRLPIIQGPSATLIGTLAPVAGQLGAPAMWGGVFLGALAETAIGASRTLGSLRRLFPPVVSGVVILSIGLSLGQLAVRLSVGDGSSANFAFAAAVITLVLLLQVGGRNVLGGILSRAAIFIVIWTVSLGVGGLLGKVDWALVSAKPWFQLPWLFPYGGPGFGWELGFAAILAVFAGFFGSMVESIGDYVATCSVAGERFENRHMNRGIFAEGLGCLLAACLGGLPCTSYTQNVGIIATTRVASRHVVRVAALILLAYGLCPKFGALLVAMPRPVLGGVFVIVCAMICATGIRILAPALESTASQLTVGVTLVLSVGLPLYVQSRLGPDWLQTLPELASLLLTNSVVLAVLTAVGLNALLGEHEPHA